ncbi:MAG: dihydrodipicolinate synthase family protein [Kiritimatiellae bacterium]|jgi:N-acetylneuraminate lyase|nr:dihydrodipicolinate synthase family protein [Kiritimatiellia bacterium]
MKKLKGLVAAAHTPFNPDGSVNLALIPKQAETLIKQKVVGVYISGTTGEGICCSIEERKAVFDAWVKAAKGKLILIAHIGALALPDVQELGAYAVKCGMDATSIVPPNFFKPGSIDALVAYLKEALKTSEKLPFYYYHTGMSGVNFDMQKFLEAADGKIKNLAGIKFNYPDLYMFQRCQRCCGGKYDITWGVDEWFSGAVAIGAESAIGSTYNYSAGIYYKIWEAVKKGDIAKAKAGMKKVCDIVDILVQYGGVAGGKAMMKVWGLDMGGVRLPNVSLTEEQKADCVARLKKIGYK